MSEDDSVNQGVYTRLRVSWGKTVMKLVAKVLVGITVLASSLEAGELEVTNIRASHRSGQTFVTWKDVAEGEAGAGYRYSVYRSDTPVTQENLSQAERVIQGIHNNSCKLFGAAFNPQDRLDPSKPTCKLEEKGEPLPLWTGAGVHTVRKDGKGYYAVVATDLEFNPVTKVLPGESATLEPVEEEVAPIHPIKQYDSRARGVSAGEISGRNGLPLKVALHASAGRGGGASKLGDYYLYFSPREWGYREGLPGVFSVEERTSPSGNILVLQTRDAIVPPHGERAMETFWFGYTYVLPAP